jgi:dihydrofolate reductase
MSEASSVVWHITMSLDGFITGPGDSMEWAFEYPGPHRIADEVMKSTGAILAGRRWYEVATARYGGRGGIYGGAWDGPVFVLTHESPEAPADEGITFLTSELGDAVATAKRAAGDGNLEIFGANVAAQCLDAGLLDEIVVHVAPVLLGDGVRLYGEAVTDHAPIALERTDVAESGQLTSLRFRVGS